MCSIHDHQIGPVLIKKTTYSEMASLQLPVKHIQHPAHQIGKISHLGYSPYVSALELREFVPWKSWEGV